MTNFSVIGSGSWGTALASVLANNNCSVSMWSHSDEVAEEITTKHTNKRYLPNSSLPKGITCTTSIKEALKDSNLILITVPSKAMREVAKKIAPLIKEDTIIIHASKGLETSTSKRMTEVLEEEMPKETHQNISVLSGPSHAEEVIDKKPTTVSISSKNNEIAKKIQKIFSNDYFRVYTNNDIIGVELGGTLKNVVAIGAGICDGLHFGDNAKAALLTRSIVEIIRFGTFFGAKPETFYGLTGLGDLIVTGTSVHSRNWKLGNLIAKGKSVEEAVDSLGMVAEGVNTSKVIYRISKEKEIDMPIFNTIHEILFAYKKPNDGVLELMNRGLKEETNN